MDTKEHIKRALANTFSLALKSQNYHWNVVGPNFASYHALFEEQYTDLYQAVDQIAEHLRTFDTLAPGSFAAFQSLSSISEGDGTKSAEEMISDLLSDHELMVKQLKEGIIQTAESGDELTADLFTERGHVHEKMAWMLRSTLGRLAKV